MQALYSVSEQQYTLVCIDLTWRASDAGEEFNSGQIVPKPLIEWIRLENVQNLRTDLVLDDIPVYILEEKEFNDTFNILDKF